MHKFKILILCARSKELGNGNLEPMLVVKMNREDPLAVIDLDHFFQLLSRAN